VVFVAAFAVRRYLPPDRFNAAVTGEPATAADAAATVAD
jgi:hypothetical protein